MRYREYRPTNTYPGQTAGTHRAVVSGMPADNRQLIEEIGRLRGLLANQETQSSRQIQSVREAERRRSITFKHRIEELVSKLRREASEAKSELSSINKSHAESTSKLESEISKLKQELQNIAAAASEEQKNSAERLERDRAHHERELAQLKELLKAEKNRATEESHRHRLLSQQNVQWRRSQAATVKLAETLEQLGLSCRADADELRISHEGLAKDYESLVHESLHYQSDAEESITRLRDKASLLESDHLDLELICESLDQCIDERDAEIDELTHQLDGVFESSRINERYFEATAQELRQQVDFVEAQLVVALAEKSSLAESIAKLRTEADDFDASLFAKDQEVAATKRQCNEAQSQVDLLRRENAALGQNVTEIRECLRKQKQAFDEAKLEGEQSASNCQTLERQLTELQREKTALDNDLRQFETSARAAEANALLQANESEQLFLVRLEALESELSEQRTLNEKQLSDHQREQENWREQFTQLQSKVSASENEARGFQQRVDHLRGELESSQADARALTDQVATHANTLRLNTEEHQRQQQMIETLQHEKEQAEQRLASAEERLLESRSEAALIDRVQEKEPPRGEEDAEELRKAIEVDVEGLWTRKIGILQQQMIVQRERDHQSVVVLREKLREREDQLAVAQSNYGYLMEEYRENRDVLLRALGDLEESRSDHPPREEVKRLTRELAVQLADAAREREELASRIASLHELRTRRAA
ncbi:MAG: hypothetical protein AAF802_01130 [Planctomycetota bacterium]